MGSAPEQVATTGRFVNQAITESSAAAMSVVQPGIIFTLNDSDNPPVVYATDTTGADLGAWHVTGATNIDWESMSLGPCGGSAARRAASSCLYIGETGDNDAVYKTRALYRVAEPRVDPSANQGGGTARTATPAATPAAEKLTYRYANGPRDVEAMYVGPDGSAYLIAKWPLPQTKGHLRPAFIYRIPAEAWKRTDTVVAPLTDSLPIILGSALTRLITDASLSPDARYLAVRTYTQLYVFSADPATGQIDHRTSPSICNLAVLNEAQGEGIAWRSISGARGNFVFTSEGGHAPIKVGSCPLPHR